MVVFCIVTGLQCIVWLIFPAQFLWRGLTNKKKKQSIEYPPVSVIICARNEAANLQKNIIAFLSQAYPNDFEVLVVDDDSSDDTQAVLRAYQSNYANLNVFHNTPKARLGKKEALSHGIARAQYKWVVLSDADCCPVGSLWLQKLMAASLLQSGEITSKKLGLGYAPMMRTSGVVNIWARFETMYTALQYFSMAYMGWPFMGVGRNMALHRSLFDAVNGFEQHIHIVSGDDDLLVNHTANRSNTAWTVDKDSFVYSPSKNTLSSWLSQKRRHLSASIAYQPMHLLLLGGLAFSHSVHYGVGLILLCLNCLDAWPLVVSLYLIRMAIVWPVYRKACQVMGEGDMILFIPVLDGLLAIWQGAIAPVLLLLGPKRGW